VTFNFKIILLVRITFVFRKGYLLHGITLMAKRLNARRINQNIIYGTTVIPNFIMLTGKSQWRRQLYTKQGLGPAIYGQALSWARPENSTVRRKDYRTGPVKKF
jgi:hypothetical protein